MLLVEQVKQRLELRPDFTGKVEEAAELDAVFSDPTKLQSALRAFVVPLGRNGHPPETATRFHTQKVERVIGVGLAIRSAGDVTGKRSSAEIEAREDEIIDHLTAWTPTGFASPFSFINARLRDFREGLALTQLQFSTTSYIRKPAS